MKITLNTITLCFTFIISTQLSYAGPLREMLKERWIKKQEEKPAPPASTDVHTKIESPANYTFTFKHNGVDRYYIVHVPGKYDSKVATPLLLALHGGGGSMEYQSSDEYYKQISKSDAEGFIVVFPNGYSRLKSVQFATWNAGKCCGDARDKESDDVGFIKEVVSLVSKQLNINQNKIFATGMSNGGMMSYRLACEIPGTFKAIAAVAGTDNSLKCSPEKPISILHIHAKDDDHVLFNGGAGKVLNEAKVTNFSSVPDTVSKWVKQNGCDLSPKRILEKPGAYCDLYSKCKNNTEVELCVTETGGHSWPGGKKPRGGGNPSTAISANDIMWDFFRNK
jgi:polyhydroxybutyrate depolymerase